MNQNYYSLHIGVNKYHPNSTVPHLGGCAQDVAALKSFLEEILSKDNFHSEVLLDDQATYQNIIDYFGEKHLLKAKQDDVVVIQYSGHGAREKAAPEFLNHFPEGFSETLVCYDSRTPTGFDLADKELAVLIDRIASQGAHVVLIMDCCHSGSISRDLNSDDNPNIKKRQFLAKLDTRPYEKYLNGHFSKQYPHGEGLSIPSSKHIVLAACRKNETALEIGGQGFFTTNLVKVLKETNANINYTNLFSKCIVEMARRSQHQHPQFEPSGFFNSQSGFLKRGTTINESFWQMTKTKTKWEIKCGAIHGLPISEDKNPIFEILEGGEKIGIATSYKVQVDSCYVKLDFVPENGKTYDARLISLPDHPILFCLEADAAGQKRLNAALAKNELPLFFQLEKEIQSSFKVVASESTIEIFRKNGDLIRKVDGDLDDEVFEDVFSVLNIMAEWEKLLELDNATTTLKKDKVQLILHLLGEDADGKIVTTKTLIGNEINLDLKMENGEEVPLRFQVDILNKDTVNEMNVALFYFSSDFEIIPYYKDTIPPNKKAIAIDKDEDGDYVEIFLDGKEGATDHFKLFVSTKEVSTYLLEKQATFEVGEQVSYLSSEGATKAIGKRKKKSDDKKLFISDWYTKKMTISSVLAKDNIEKYESNLSEDEIELLITAK